MNMDEKMRFTSRCWLDHGLDKRRKILTLINLAMNFLGEKNRRSGASCDVVGNETNLWNSVRRRSLTKWPPCLSLAFIAWFLNIKSDS